jgi:hypothetical protein
MVIDPATGPTLEGQYHDPTPTLLFKGKEATFDYQAHISEKPVNSE